MSLQKQLGHLSLLSILIILMVNGLLEWMIIIISTLLLIKNSHNIGSLS